MVSHYEKPHNVGSFDKNDPNVGTGLVGAPACGDVMKLQIKVRLPAHWLEHTTHCPGPSGVVRLMGMCRAKPLEEACVAETREGRGFQRYIHT